VNNEVYIYGTDEAMSDFDSAVAEKRKIHVSNQTSQLERSSQTPSDLPISGPGCNGQGLGHLLDGAEEGA
jgi:hypothetical protein